MVEVHEAPARELPHLMRILMTADPLGGVWSYAISLCRGLAEHEVDVVLATMGAPLSDSQRREVAAVATVTLEERHFKLDWMAEPWADVEAAGEWLQALARRYAVDAVHLNHLTHGHLDYGAPVLTVMHACVLSWWQAVRHEEAPWYYARYREAVRASLAGSTAVATASHTLARTLQRYYGPIADVTVIRHARAPAPSMPVAKVPMVFTAARLWDRANNVAAVVRSAPRLPWPVFVAGEERTPDEGMAATVASGLVDVIDVEDDTGADGRAVHFTGTLSSRELAPLYAAASIYALPARYAPFGRSVLEAAQAGCALLLGDIPSLREMWHGAALFVPPDDDAALSAALLDLMTDPGRRTRLANAARQRAAGCSFDHSVREYLLAYRTMRGGYASLFDGVRQNA